MGNFVYDIPTRVYFGKNQIEGNLKRELKTFGSNVLLAYGGGSIKKIGLYQRIMTELENEGFNLFELNGIEPNPRIQSVREGVEICKREKIDVILAVGGGSVIDCAKFIAVGTFYNDDSWKLVTGEGKIEKGLPLVSVLTLSATGSEMDGAAVISNLEITEKKANRSKHMQPKVSFLEPELTFSVSPYQTACGSCDILSHIMEVYFNTNENMFMLDGVMEGLMKTVIKYAPIALNNPTDYEARANLMWASSWAINGFVSCGKSHAWSCHPIEHELSAFYDITHGLGLAIVTPRWLEFCLNDKTVDRIANFAVKVFSLDETMEKFALAKLAIEKLKEFFFETLKVDDNLTKLNITSEHFELMGKNVAHGGTLNGFVSLSASDITTILTNCL